LTILTKSKTDAFQLIHGDALETLRGIPSKSVDFVFADPPYFLSNDGISVQSGRQVLVNKGIWDRSSGFEADFTFHLAWLSEVKRILTPNGTVAVSGTYHSIYQCGFAIQQLGFRVLNEIAWFKPNAAPNLAGRNFAAAHETIIWASKDSKSRHVYNYEAMRDNHFPGDQLKNPGKQMRSVWSIPTTPKREKTFGKHPTQKPVALLERFVLGCTLPGQRILDPFCGSGTTGVVAVSHGRPFIGIDNNLEFIELSRKRMEDV
jgi:site-specific DNA-methyltransferase (adenine-specific)